MPDPFPKNSSGIGGELNAQFYSTVSSDLNYLDMALVRLINDSEFDEWIYSHSSSTSDYTAINELANLYSLVWAFDIPETTVRELLVSQREFILENKINDSYFSEDDINLLLSLDNTAVAQRFVSPYEIQKGENIYSVKWMYQHPVTDYTAAGITKNDVESRLNYYSEFAYTAVAKSAFEKKLSEFLDKEVVLKTEEKYSITAKGLTYTIEWLGMHTIQDYEKAGITTEQLSNLLANMTGYESTPEYDWIKGAYDRMIEDGM